MDFKFKVVGCKKDDGDGNLTINKIYEAKDGTVRGNDGYPFTAWANDGATFENLQKWWFEWYVLELVTDDPVANDPVNHPAHYMI